MLFNYPKQSKIGSILPKNKLYAKAKLTAALKKKFIGQIDKIVWEYKLSPETVNLPTKHSILEIQVFTVFLRQAEIAEDVLRCIDNAIPHPIIFELVFENRVKTKAAFKRPNEAEAGKFVTEIYFETDWQSLDSARENLPIALDLDILYEKILRVLMPKSKDGESLREQVQRLAKIRHLETEAGKLEAKMSKEKQFNRKVELNTELRKLRKEIIHHRDTEFTEFS